MVPPRGPARLVPALLSLALVLTPRGGLRAQLLPVPQDEGAAGVGLALRHVPVSGTVLYVTAHPDDENNGVLVMLNRGRGLRTALLTLTRGDGGQNEIGPELFEALGILRTEELAAVHRYDCAEQYFTRAYEFGYSFSVEETFAKWGREEILADVVRVVRAVRPDVILTLPIEAPGGGQHHQAAARLALEAFRAAADPNRFPEQIREGLRPWQALKIYQGGVGGIAEGLPSAPAVKVRTAEYDTLLGMSWHQYGILARTNHRCQGTSQLLAGPGAGEAIYALLDSEPKVGRPEGDILEGVDTTISGLARFVKGDEASLATDLRAIEADAWSATEAFDARAPHKTLSPLAAALARVRSLRDKVRARSPNGAGQELVARLDQKERDVEKALALAQGLAFEVAADDGDVVPGQTFTVTTRAFNRGPEPLRIDGVSLRVPAGWTARHSSGAPATLAQEAPAAIAPGAPVTIAPGQGLEVKYAVTVAEKARYSQPYWKRNERVDRYDLEVPQHQTLPWSPPDVVALLEYATHGVSATVERPACWRYEGRWLNGEKQKIVNVVPALSVKVTPEIAVIPVAAAKPTREFRVAVVNETKGPAKGSLRLELPRAWTWEPREAPLDFRYGGEEITTRFFVTPPAGFPPGESRIGAAAGLGGREYREGYQVIAYDHIQERHLFHPAVSRVKAIDAKLAPGVAVGYVMGAGDDVPRAIEQLGARMTLLTADDLAWGDLSAYTTIVTGIRAYQTRHDLRAHNRRLLQYVQDGGNLVVQYNKFEFNELAETPQIVAFGMSRERNAISPFAPYPAAVTSNRVTVEEAPVRFLVPGHTVMTVPNKITATDFDGWVQERGLYFLGAKDPRYTELLAAADPWPNNPGEKVGMLVEARVGKGTWTYVGLGLWRQLPAGTTGAYRILANLLSRPRGR